MSVRNGCIEITVWTIGSASVFSYSGESLVNILDSKMYQTGCKACPAPPQRKSKKSDFRKYQPGPKHAQKDLYNTTRMLPDKARCLSSRFARLQAARRCVYAP